MKSFFFLLEHEFSLHGWVSDSEDSSTVQSSPSNSGAGLSQTRDLSWTPPPQLNEQFVQEPHSPHSPFTILHNDKE